MKAPAGDSFLESLMDTNLYSMGAYFSDQHPGPGGRGDRAERRDRGARASAATPTATAQPEECFETLMTGLAVRYYKAVGELARRGRTALRYASGRFL